MSDIEEDAENVGVEAYMLKKITKDLPLHPDPAALKGNHVHVSDLKLADSDFRTPAHIDLLLGAEVFTSILCDSRRTGPQGTPSAINTCFGWMLFGKTECSDVVDAAKFTLEQDILRELTGSRHSYEAVLTTNKNRDLRYLRRRNGRVVEGQPPTWSRESDQEDCQTRKKGFGRSRISQGAKANRFPPGKCWRGTWETKGFLPAECCCQIAIN